MYATVPTVVPRLVKWASSEVFVTPTDGGATTTLANPKSRMLGWLSAEAAHASRRNPYHITHPALNCDEEFVQTPWHVEHHGAHRVDRARASMCSAQRLP